MRLIDANALEKNMYSVADLSCSENIHVDVIADIIGNAQTVDAVPCDVCRYSPPSSGDGKPCTVCPAEGKDGDHETD